MKKRLFLLGLLWIALLAHTFSQYRLFSLFQAVESIPLLLILVTPIPAVLTVCIYLILELFSSLPQGSILPMFIIPYLVLLFWKSLHVDLSWKFFFGVLSIITLQSITLLGIVALTHPSHALDIPWHIVIGQIPITSLGTFALAFIYREYSERL